MQKIKIAVTSTTFPLWKGDTQPSFVFELSKRLSENFVVYVMAPYAVGSATCEEMDTIKVVRYKYLPLGLGTLAYNGGILPKLKQNKLNFLQIPFLLISQFINLAILVTKERIGFVHAHWIIPQGLIAVLCKLLFNKQLKILVTAHGGDILGLRGRFATALKRFVFKHIDCLTVVSNALRNEAIKMGCACKIQVSPMGIDTNLFSPNCRSRSIHGEHGISGPLLLFVGRLVEKKGVEYLVRAIPKVLLLHPSARLMIVGDGPLRTELESLVFCLGLHDAVIFTGSVPHDQLPVYFASADIFVGPSVVAAGGDSEGFGLVFAEAMSCGTPVIASDLPAVRDIIIGRETGFFVRQKDPDHIAECIIEVLDSTDNLEHMKVAARKHIVSNFDWHVVSQKYSNIIEEIIVSKTEA